MDNEGNLQITQTLKTTLLLGALVTSIMSFSPVSAACDETGYGKCLQTRVDCWKNLPADLTGGSQDWEARARKQCDEPFKECGIERKCLDATMEALKVTPAEVQPPLKPIR